MAFFKDADELDENTTCHILCSPSPRLPCMRGDLPGRCSLTRATTPESTTGRYRV